MKDTNEYEVVHVINISMELSDGRYKTISSTFKTIKAKSLTEAKKMLDEATPKGKSTMISESSNKSYKHIYIENVNEYTIKHVVYINKNGISYKDTNIDTFIDTPSTPNEIDDEPCIEEKVKPTRKKTNTSKSKKSDVNKKKRNSPKSSSTKRTRKSKRTTVEYL